ncbi:MAG: hypothetical protein ABR614_13240 [Mycobacteriales bacterium]
MAVGLGAVLAYLVAARRAAPAAAPTVASWAPDPGPVAAPAASSLPVTAAVAVPSAEDEQPLPTWVRMAIVGAALLAFLAVSLIATRNG